MAIIRLGSTVIGIRGTVAGVTFSRNKGSLYARHWSRSSNPRTPKQAASRGQPGRMAMLWQQLSGAQRDDWNALADSDPEPRFNAFGDPIDLSGFGYFTSLNQRRARLGQTMLHDAPEGDQAERPPPLTSVSAQFFGSTEDDDAFNFAFYFWDDSDDPLAGDTAVSFAGFATSPGASKPRVGPRFAVHPAFVLGTGIIAAEDVFGSRSPAVGYRGFLTLYRQRASGLRSIAVELTGLLEEE